MIDLLKSMDINVKKELFENAINFILQALNHRKELDKKLVSKKNYTIVENTSILRDFILDDNKIFSQKELGNKEHVILEFLYSYAKKGKVAVLKLESKGVQRYKVLLGV